MKTRFLHLNCSLLIVIGLCLPQIAGAAIIYDVYLIDGQSNADGRGIASSTDLDSPPKGNFLSASNYAAYSGVQSDVKIYYSNPSASNNTPKNSWQSLKPGFDGSTNVNRAYFGPEVSFGRAMADALPGHHIALIKYAAGGTNLRTDWNPDSPAGGGPEYVGFKSTVAAGLAALTAQGNSYVVKGMIWHQGESDVLMDDGVTLTPTATYEAELKNFIGSVRQDLSLPSLPFVVGEVYHGTGVYARDNIRAAQLDTSQTYPETGFASSAGLTVWDGTTHFNSDSQILLGQRFATSMQSLAVPEPTGMVLFAVAGVTMLRRGRRLPGRG